MNRILHFFSNVRGIYWLQLIWVGYVLFVNIRADLLMGIWPYTLTALILPIFLFFFIKEFLVEHSTWSSLIMNGIIIAWVGLVSFVIPRENFMTLPGRIAVSLFLGIFLGVYFWLFSDPRISTRTELQEEE